MKRVKIVKTPAGYRSPDGKMHQTVNDAALHCSGGRKYNISPRKPVKMTFDDDDKMNDEKMNDDDMKRMTDELRYEREQFDFGNGRGLRYSANH